MSHVDVVPLGGLGEIGKNTMVVEHGSDVFLIDAGLAFPDEEMLGVDVVIPDYSYLLERKSRLRGIVLTHGHEDHVGSLPYLLKQVDVPVYGTRMTLALAARRLSEHGIDLETRSHTVRPGQTIKLGSMSVEFFRVHHSIVDAVGLAINTGVGTLVHSGDFKFDQTPLDDQPADFARLSQYGDRGVLALLSDSTNADRPGYTASEREVGIALDRIFSESGRIIVACFASNVPRMQQIAAATVRHDRHLVVTGRSMESVTEVAMDLGYLHLPPGVLLQPERIDEVPPDKLVVLTTGSQGEPMSALSRMAVGEHRWFKIVPGDTVVISASAIPGNERMVYRTVDNLFRLGARVVYDRSSGVHVSGHASQEELKLMINLVRPRYLIPIHGQYRHLIRHAELARDLGIPSDNVLVGDNGTVFRFKENHGYIADSVPAGNVLVDGLGVGDVGNVVLRDRRQLSEDGIVVVVLARNGDGVVSQPRVITRGFVYVRESEDLIAGATDLVHGLCRDGQAPSRSKLRDTLGRYLYERTGRRPMILPVMVDLGNGMDSASSPA